MLTGRHRPPAAARTLAGALAEVGYDTAVFPGIPELSGALLDGFETVDAGTLRAPLGGASRGEGAVEAFLRWLGHRPGSKPFFALLAIDRPRLPFSSPRPFDRTFFPVGKEPSPTALDSRRVVVRLARGRDSETGAYTLKRWRVSERGAGGEIVQITLKPDNGDFRPIILSPQSGDLRIVAEFIEADVIQMPVQFVLLQQFLVRAIGQQAAFVE